MREQPRSRFTRDDGSFDIGNYDASLEYPEVIAWEKEYADECDRLAESLADGYKYKNWGRWYLTQYSLITKIARPKIGKPGVEWGGIIYDIDLDRICASDWVRHMSKKNWIGQKGLADLSIAIKELSKRRESK